eukprot:Gb_02238 [translate_table: standard]
MLKIMSFKMVTPAIEPLKHVSLGRKRRYSQVPKCPSVGFFISSIHRQGGKYSISSNNVVNIRSEKKKKDGGRPRHRQKQNSSNQSNQIGGLGFALLGALKSDLLHENKISPKPKKKVEETQKNAVVKTAEIEVIENSSTLQKKGKSNNTSQSAKQTNIKNSEEVLRVPDDLLVSLPSIGTSDKSRKPSLSGEDVILALQKASIEKARKTQRSRKSNRNVSSSAESKGFPEGYRDVGEVRPITIKSEWLDRIEDLEKRLKDVKEKQI